MVVQRIPALAPSVLVGGVWCWAVLRLVLIPGDAGPLESTVAVGGWGLSVLPVHVVAAPAGAVPARAGPAGALRRRRSAGSG
jgi:hypothetical protein